MDIDKYRLMVKAMTESFSKGHMTEDNYTFQIQRVQSWMAAAGLAWSDL